MIYWLVSFFLGAAAVLQGGLNRQIAREWGLSTAILLNSVLLVFVTTIFFLCCQFYPQSFPESFASKFNSSSLQQLRWWFVLPALCGFLLVSLIPALIPKLGASGVFLCVVVGQMTFSLFWDVGVEQLPIDSKRLIGISLAIIGLLISNWKSLTI